jgi:hypothetical protein
VCRPPFFLTDSSVGCTSSETEGYGTRSVPATLADGTRSVPATLADGTRSVPATLCLLLCACYFVPATLCLLLCGGFVLDLSRDVLESNLFSICGELVIEQPPMLGE